MPNNRRSLGTKRLDNLQPLPLSKAAMSSENRVSMSAKKQARVTPGSSKRPPLRATSNQDNRLSRDTGSKVPRLSIANSRQRSGKRSMSSQPRPTMSRVPSPGSGLRSHSAQRTPNGKYASAIPGRLSLAGSAQKNEAGRASAVGTKSRVMNDKAYRKDIEREIANWLNENGYPNQIVPSSFPLSATEFKTVFVFMMRFINPDYPELPPKFEQEVPLTLQKIGYLAHVSKQTFQTLGTPHAWPSVLTTIYFLYNKARVSASTEEQIGKISFLETDGHGFHKDTISKDELQLENFIAAYKAFNRGQENYEDIDAQFEESLLQVEGVNERQLRELVREHEHIIKELKALEEEDVVGHHSELIQRKNLLEEDLKKMDSHTASIKHKLKVKEDKKLVLDDAVNLKKDKIDELKDQNICLREACKAKGMDPDNRTVHMIIENLKSSVAEKKEEVEQSNKNRWALEMKQEKLLKKLDNISLSFNRTLIDIGIKDFNSKEEKGTLILEPHTTVSDVKQFVHTLGCDIRAEERELHNSLESAKKESQALSGEVMILKKQAVGLREDLTNRREEYGRTTSQISLEAESLESAVGEVKDTLLREQDKRCKNTQALEQQLHQLLKDEKELKHRLIKVSETGKQYLETTANACLRKREIQIHHIQNLTKEATRQCDGRCERENEEIQHLKNTLSRMESKNNKS